MGNRRDLRYFHVKKIRNVKGDSISDPEWVFEVDEKTRRKTNWVGSDNFIEQSKFHLTRGGNYSVGPEYTCEEIERARALYLRAELDKSGRAWQRYNSAISSLDNSIENSVLGRQM